jgi:D-glucosaminate-6-phosphate ammonia-lyase
MTVGNLRIDPDNIYQSIGVRPFINCRGTLTVVGGSLELPEVRAAKEAAAHHFVQLDELMEGIGKRLAELTGAEWGMVASGCAAALAHATTACVTCGNPELHVRVPDLTGFPKDEVAIPKHSRNEYDQAIRSVGVRVIEAGDAAEYEAALGPKVPYRGGRIMVEDQEPRLPANLPLLARHLRHGVRCRRGHWHCALL